MTPEDQDRRNRKALILTIISVVCTILSFVSIGISVYLHGWPQ